MATKSMPSLLVLLPLLALLSAEACKPPFELIAGFCLYIDADLRLSWPAAKAHCSGINGQLVACYRVIAAIDTIRLLNRLSTSSPTWTGINDIRSERGGARDGWQLGESGSGILPANDSLWVGGQPDNFNGIQDCVAIQKTGYLLNDHNCDFELSLMCEPAKGVWQKRQFLASTSLAWNSTVQIYGLNLQSCAFKAGAQLNCARFAHRSDGGGECVLDGCYGNQSNGSNALLMAQDEWKIFEFDLLGV